MPRASLFDQDDRNLAVKGLRDHASLWKRDAGEAAEAAGRTWFWTKYLVKGCVCWLVGHRWGRWEASTSIFAPPERNRCRRCGVTKYRGESPKVQIKFETGSLL